MQAARKRVPGTVAPPRHEPDQRWRRASPASHNNGHGEPCSSTLPHSRPPAPAPAPSTRSQRYRERRDVHVAGSTRPRHSGPPHVSVVSSERPQPAHAAAHAGPHADPRVFRASLSGLRTIVGALRHPFPPPATPGPRHSPHPYPCSHPRPCLCLLPVTAATVWWTVWWGEAQPRPHRHLNLPH